METTFVEYQSTGMTRSHWGLRIYGIIIGLLSIFFLKAQIPIVSYLRPNIDIIKNGSKYTFTNKDDSIYIENIDTIINAERGYYKIKKSKKWGVLSDGGRFILSPLYDSINETLYYSSFMFIVKQANAFGVSDQFGQLIVPIQYDSIYIGQRLLTLLKDNKKSYVLNNKILPYEIDPNRSYSNSFFERYFVFYDSNKKTGLINVMGQVIIPPIYEDMKLFDARGPFFPTKSFLVKKNNLWGIINIAGKELIPPLYEDIHEFSNKYIIIKTQKQNYFYDLTRKKIIKKFGFDYFQWRSDPNYITVMKKKKESLVSADNVRLVLPFKYDDIKPNKEHSLFIIQQGGKFGVVNIKDQIVLPIIYDYAAFFCKNKIVIKQENKYGIVDIMGKAILPINERKIIVYEDYIEMGRDHSFIMDKFDCNLDLISN